MVFLANRIENIPPGPVNRGSRDDDGQWECAGVEPRPQERKWVAVEAAASCSRISPRWLPGVLPRQSVSATTPATPNSLPDFEILEIYLAANSYARQRMTNRRV